MERRQILKPQSTPPPPTAQTPTPTRAHARILAMRLRKRSARLLILLVAAVASFPFLAGLLWARLPGSERRSVRSNSSSSDGGTAAATAARAAGTLRFRGFTGKEWTVARELGERVEVLSGPGFTLAAVQASGCLVCVWWGGGRGDGVGCARRPPPPPVAHTHGALARRPRKTATK